MTRSHQIMVRITFKDVDPILPTLRLRTGPKPYHGGASKRSETSGGHLAHLQHNFKFDTDDDGKISHWPPQYCHGDKIKCRWQDDSCRSVSYKRKKTQQVRKRPRSGKKQSDIDAATRKVTEEKWLYERIPL